MAWAKKEKGIVFNDAKPPPKTKGRKTVPPIRVQMKGDAPKPFTLARKNQSQEDSKTKDYQGEGRIAFYLDGRSIIFIEALRKIWKTNRSETLRRLLRPYTDNLNLRDFREGKIPENSKITANIEIDLNPENWQDWYVG